MSFKLKLVTYFLGNSFKVLVQYKIDTITIVKHLLKNTKPINKSMSIDKLKPNLGLDTKIRNELTSCNK